MPPLAWHFSARSSWSKKGSGEVANPQPKIRRLKRYVVVQLGSGSGDGLGTVGVDDQCRIVIRGSIGLLGIEQGELAPKLAQYDFRRVAVLAVLVFVFTGFQLTFEIDLAALFQETLGNAD